jgi:hypothetical protein
MIVDKEGVWLYGETEEHLELNSAISQNVFKNHSRGIKKKNSDVADSFSSMLSHYMKEVNRVTP